MTFAAESSIAITGRRASLQMTAVPNTNNKIDKNSDCDSAANVFLSRSQDECERLIVP